MDEITVGILTVSDSCFKKEATDESGPNLVSMIEKEVIKSGKVLKLGLVPDCREAIEKILKDWCEEGIHVILTTGGTGLSKRDVTPEATTALSEKLVPGMSQLMLYRSSMVTSLAALSRAVVGVRGNTLMINLPGSKKGSQECLEAVAEVIPHAIHLITNETAEVRKVHTSLMGKKNSSGQRRSVVPVNEAARVNVNSEYPCISVAEAQKIIQKRVFLLKKEKTIRCEQAWGYVLAQEVIAKDDLPPCDVSIMDGFAVISSDQALRKRVLGISNAGDSPANFKVVLGTCVAVSTGAAIPPGADAVVEVEYTSDLSNQEIKSNFDSSDQVIINEKPVVGKNIRRKGSDFKAGERLLSHDTYLDAAALGIMAAAGVTSVRVFNKPLVAVMSTGNELVDIADHVQPGKVRDSNRITLTSLLMEENFQVIDLGIVSDNPDKLRNTLELGFQKADVVVTTGSMSMGVGDYLKKILISDFGAEICFGRVLMKPGKPTAFGIVTFEGDPKLWFGLPGNPASSFVTAHLFLLPALKLIAGLRGAFPNHVKVNLNKIVLSESRPQYIRGILTYSENEWVATVLEHQRSSSIRGCLNVNCLIEIPSSCTAIDSDENFRAWIIGKNLNLAFNCV